MFRLRWTTIPLVLPWLLVATAPAPAALAGDAGATVSVGVARIDVTPDGPIRLHG